jgi:HPt (histidine-containing phosphotransfer) domain-containing protein
VQKVFLNDCPQRLTAIKEAVDGKDPQRIRAETHVLKGAAANLSAAHLLEATRALERIGEEGLIEHADLAWRHVADEAERLMVVLRRETAAETAPVSVAV